MGKLKLRIVGFIDFVDLKYPGVANLNFIYPIWIYRFVVLTKFMVGMELFKTLWPLFTDGVQQLQG